MVGKDARDDSTAGYFEEEPAVVLVHESLPLESVHREQERFHRLPVPCGSNQHGTRIQKEPFNRYQFLAPHERILMAPPCRLIVYQTIDERDDMSGRNPFIVSCRNVMPRQPNRWITDSF